MIDGVPAHEITYKDAKGNMVSLAPAPGTGAALTVADGRAMMERARQLRAKLQSSSDGG